MSPAELVVLVDPYPIEEEKLESVLCAGVAMDSPVRARKVGNELVS